MGSVTPAGRVIREGSVLPGACLPLVSPSSPLFILSPRTNSNRLKTAKTSGYVRAEPGAAGPCCLLLPFFPGILIYRFSLLVSSFTRTFQVDQADLELSVLPRATIAGVSYSVSFLLYKVFLHSLAYLFLGIALVPEIHWLL